MIFDVIINGETERKVVAILEKATDNSQTLWGIALGASAAIFAGIVAPIIVSYFSRVSSEKNEQYRLANELQDLVRHLRRNLVAIAALERSVGLGNRPATTHYKKLIIPTDSILFSSETFRGIDHEKCVKLNQLKLRLRNLNIDVDHTIEFLNKNGVTKDLLEKHNIYLKKAIPEIQVDLMRMSYVLSDHALFDETHDRKKIYQENEFEIERDSKNKPILSYQTWGDQVRQSETNDNK